LPLVMVGLGLIGVAQAGAAAASNGPVASAAAIRSFLLICVSRRISSTIYVANPVPTYFYNKYQ
jgi:hypothetical protein